VRIFKPLAALFFLTIGWGQGYRVQTSDNGRFIAADSADISGWLMERLERNGGAGSYYVLEWLKLADSIKVRYRLQDTDVRVDSLVFIDNNPVIPVVRKRLFGSLLNSRPVSESDMLFRNILGSYSFITPRTTLEFARFGNDRIGAVIDFRPQFESNFTGIMGANRGVDGKWQITGEIDIHLENTWRTAGVVDVFWKRTDAWSQILQLAYEEPHPFGLPIGGRFEFSQDLREGLYVNTTVGASAVSFVRWGGKWRLGGRTTTILPTTRGDSTGVEKLISKTILLESVLDRRNDRWLPTGGIYWNFTGEIGNQKQLQTNKIVSKFHVLFGAYKPLTDKLNLHMRIWSKGVNVFPGMVHVGEKIRYGGANTIRGYREEILISDRVMIPSLELNYRLGNRSGMFIFADLAIQNKYTPFPRSTGIGYKQVNRNSVIEIIYGVGREDSIINGKLHIKFTSRI